MKFISMIVMSVVAAVIYGEIHDQVTIRICPEYFTVAHPHVSDTQSLTILAAIWGIIATWWVGASLGLLLACASAFGAAPQMHPRLLVRPIVVLLACMFVGAMVAGIIGYGLFKGGALIVTEPWKTRIPSAHHSGFIFDIWAHLGSYLLGLCGGIWLAIYVVRQRRTMRAA